WVDLRQRPERAIAPPVNAMATLMISYGATVPDPIGRLQSERVSDMRRATYQVRTASEAGSADGQLDLTGHASALWRRKRWIVLPTILAGIAAGVFVMLATPQYRSQALVLIENRETAYNRPEGSDRGAERLRPDPEAIQSEVQLALSRDLARTVVRNLK